MNKHLTLVNLDKKKNKEIKIMGKFSEKALKIKAYVQAHENENITYTDISEALGGNDTGFGPKSVNATLTAAFTNHKEPTGEEIDGKPVKEVRPLMERVPGEIQIEDEAGKKNRAAVET